MRALKKALVKEPVEEEEVARKSVRSWAHDSRQQSLWILEEEEENSNYQNEPSLS